MAQRKCEKCGEAVDEAKAFCPACGEAFVAEDRRAETSVFESMEGTMQLGNTMYNQLLSDMDLNLSAKPDRDDAPTEPAINIPSSAIPAPKASVSPSPSASSSLASGGRMWLIVGLIALALFFVILLVLFAAGYIFYRSQGA
jgi:hypothetical protein